MFTLLRDGEVEKRELRLDLRSVDAVADDAGRWLAWPSLLRRVAREFAERVPPQTDRLISVGRYAEVIGAAVSLATGLPFAARTSADASLGAVPAGETAVVLSIAGSADEPGMEFDGVHIIAWLSVFSVPRDERWQPLITVIDGQIVTD